MSDSEMRAAAGGTVKLLPASHGRPPCPDQLADGDGNHEADKAEKDPHRQVGLLLEFLPTLGRLRRPTEEGRAHEQDDRHGGGEERDDLQQHDLLLVVRGSPLGAPNWRRAALPARLRSAVFRSVVLTTFAAALYIRRPWP